MTSPHAQPTSRRTRPKLTDEIRDAIAQELILSEEFKPGEGLPTEGELCQRYGVSRVTVRAALRSLQETGYITIRQGKGSTVLPRPQALAQGLDRLSSLESLAADQGAQVSSTDLDVIERPLDRREAERLERLPGTSALVIQRVKLYDNNRAAWMTDYVPEGVMPFDKLKSEFDGSVLDVLLAHDELDVQYSDCQINAVGLPREIAQKLNVREGVPAIYLDELTRTGTGHIVNWALAWLLPEHFNISVRRRSQFSRKSTVDTPDLVAVPDHRPL